MDTAELLGPEGIRGPANTVMTPERALRIGLVIGHSYRRGSEEGTVVIGKDTRLSGYMIEPALTAGFTAAGMNVLLTGPMPAPAVARLVESTQCVLGMMVTGSHESYEQTGLKIFGPQGYRMSRADEGTILSRSYNPPKGALVASASLGRTRRIEAVIERYIEHLKRSAEVPRLVGKRKYRVVIDCANGAAYKVGPQALWELGFEVVSIGVEPNGTNINEGFGIKNLVALRKEVHKVRADFGFALDGDADRVVMVDQNGLIIEPYHVAATIATSLRRSDRLDSGMVVGDTHSTLELVAYLDSIGLGFSVSDKEDVHVCEHMRSLRSSFGYRDSGQYVVSTIGPTADGLVAALLVLAEVVHQGHRASVVCRPFQIQPPSAPRDKMIQSKVAA